MKRDFVTGSLVLPIFIIILAGCVKDNDSTKLPDLLITLNPTQGLTTDVFEITLTPATTGKSGQEIYYRWDWNNDGVWDTKFSSANQIRHRFFSPGNQLVRVDYADGKKQVKSVDITIPIAQGYSAPHPHFSVLPGKGNILTVFSFDASLTSDDEDSINQLKFRWDFLGEGHWYSEYSSSQVASYQYKNPGTYLPKLEVRDPSGRFATFTGEIIINMEDSMIIPRFTLADTLVRVGDTLIFDASESYHSKDPRRLLLYSWMLPDQVEWTIPGTEKQRISIIRQVGQFSVALRVIDKATGLFNVASKLFFAADKNLPPTARIRAGSPNGNITTQFYFDAWMSSDDTEAPSELQVLWDFDGDGNWDTESTTDKVIFHQYDAPGTFTLILQVKDAEGLSSVARKQIYVSPYTNETGYILDQRDGSFYGTVKLGNQWWLSQNLNFTIPQKLVGGVYQWLCLYETPVWCDRAGKMYRIAAVVRDRLDAEYVNVCPTGWHLPSREDWETLFGAIGGEQNGKELRYGGKADFNAVDLGYLDWYFVYQGFMIVDTVFVPKDTFQKSWFLSTTEPKNEARTDMWMWNTDKATLTTWTGFSSRQFYMPARCVKDN